MPEEEILATRVRPPTPEETALHEWFVEQEKDPVTALDEAAKLIIQLVSALYAVVFGILSLAADPLPSYLTNDPVRLVGALTVLAYLVALLFALIVVVPSKYRYARASQTQRQAVFDSMMARKVGALRVALVAFAIGSIAFAMLFLSILFSL